MVIDLFVEAVVGDGYNDCVWQFRLQIQFYFSWPCKWPSHGVPLFSDICDIDGSAAELNASHSYS